MNDESFLGKLLTSHQKEVEALKIAHQTEVGVLGKRFRIYEDELLYRHGNFLV